MAATHTVTQNPVKITVSGTSDNTIDLDNVLIDSMGTAVIEWVSGTSIQLSVKNVTIVSANAAINSTQSRMILPVQKGEWIRCKGSAGSETFNITVLPE